MTKNLICCTLALLALVGCSDADLTEIQAKTAKKSTQRSATTLNLADFTPCSTFHETSTGDTDASAANVICLQQQIDAAHASGMDGLYVGPYDFYVNMAPGQIYSLSLPDHFTLQLDPACVIRQTPNGLLNYSMLFVNQTSNTTIIGGTLVGERAQHTDTNPDHQFGHLILVKGASHTTIDGVHLEKAFGDGIMLTQVDIDHPSEFTEVMNCDFNWIRRNSITVAAAHDVDIHDNAFQNTGLSIPNSPGTAPGLAVDVEGTRYWNNGQLVWTQHPHHVNITRNTDVGSKLGFEAAVCDYVTMTYNTCTSTLGAGFIYQTGDHVTISYNKVYGNNVTGGGIGAGVGNNPGQQTTVVHDNQVTDNEIYDCRIGIDFRNDLSQVFRNKIVNCKSGIQCTDIRDCEVSLNRIESNVDNAFGISIYNCPANNFYLRGNTINLTGATASGVVFKLVNKLPGQEQNMVYFWGNDVSATGEATFTNITGFDIAKNYFRTEGGVKLTNNISTVKFYGNSVELSAASGQEGIQISKADGVFVTSNDIKMFTTNASRNAIWGSAIQNSSIVGNTIHMDLPGQLGKAIYIMDLANCKVTDNIGDIGNTKYMLFLTATSNPPFASVNIDYSNNKALTSFYFRQSIFGTAQFYN